MSRENHKILSEQSSVLAKIWTLVHDC
jgi:hypothetical protein